MKKINLTEGTQFDTQSVSAESPWRGRYDVETPKKLNEPRLETSLLIYTKAANRCIFQNEIYSNTNAIQLLHTHIYICHNNISQHTM